MDLRARGGERESQEASSISDRIVLDIIRKASDRHSLALGGYSDMQNTRDGPPWAMGADLTGNTMDPMGALLDFDGQEATNAIETNRNWADEYGHEGDNMHGLIRRDKREMRQRMGCHTLDVPLPMPPTSPAMKLLFPPKVSSGGKGRIGIHGVSGKGRIGIHGVTGGKGRIGIHGVSSRSALAAAAVYSAPVVGTRKPSWV